MIHIYILKRSSKRPLFNFIFSDLVLMILKLSFAQICAFQWTKAKWCFGRVLFHFTIFGLKNAKNKFLKKIRVLSAVFFQIEVQVIQTCLADLKKNTEFLLMNECL